MSRKQTRRTPSFRHHKGTGQGFVELDGRRIYLGRYDNPESSERYHRLIAEWLANGRQLPVEPHDLTITELIALFWKHVEAHYRRADGSARSGTRRVQLCPIVPNAPRSDRGHRA